MGLEECPDCQGTGNCTATLCTGCGRSDWVDLPWYRKKGSTYTIWADTIAEEWTLTEEDNNIEYAVKIPVDGRLPPTSGWSLSSYADLPKNQSAPILRYVNPIDAIPSAKGLCDRRRLTGQCSISRLLREGANMH